MLLMERIAKVRLFEQMARVGKRGDGETFGKGGLKGKTPIGGLPAQEYRKKTSYIENG